MQQLFIGPLCILLACAVLPNTAPAQQTGNFKVRADILDGLTPQREAKMHQAMAVFEKVMNDSDFRKNLLDTSFYFDVVSDTNRNLTVRQIVDKIYEGKEFYKPEANYQADLRWFVKFRWQPPGRHPTFGFGNEDSMQIYTYSWFINKRGLDEIAGHIAHEWAHKLGFQHTYDRNDHWPDTVPYCFGNMVEKYARKYIPR